MKKGERVLCLKRQRSNILGFQLTDILSIRSEYLSKKKKTKPKQSASKALSSSWFVWSVFTFGQDISLHWDEFSSAGLISKIQKFRKSVLWAQ